MTIFDLIITKIILQQDTIYIHESIWFLAQDLLNTWMGLPPVLATYAVLLQEITD